MQFFTLPAMFSRADQLRRIAAELAALPTDTGWRIEVHADDGRRSNQQNRYLWSTVYPAILTAGAESLAGWSAEDLHEFFLGEHFGWETLTGFGRKRLRPLRRSSRLSKAEFAGFIESIQVRMAGLGITIPDPEPGRARRAA